MNHDHELVLVADDDPDILDLIAFTFEDAGFEIVKASNGEDAVSIALDRQPRLAVLDVKMPKLNGLEVVHEIRCHRNTAKMPVVLMSASTQEEDISRGMEAGANDYMKKPFSPQELIVRAEKALEQS